MKIIILLAIVLFPCVAHADQVDKIVNAIYLAEGGKNAEFPFGIRSVKCSGYTECRKICRNTVKRNQQRFKKYGYKDAPDFITFLGNRYCPTQGRGLSKAEQRLKKNWIKNVKYFLERGG